MGKTRDFLDYLERLTEVHHMEEERIKKEATYNPNEKLVYQHKVAALAQKYEKNIKELIKNHITYLGAKDPYGRKPLFGAEAKKILFTDLYSDVVSLQGHAFMAELAKQINTLKSNSIIDAPRWPSLHANHVFHFFKSIFIQPQVENNEPRHVKKKQR
ncbi:MAG: hypothetical protein CK424_03170 [Legionella sp.]|nr:MAG: hypothetical protein CK424_03170 [Legionella sp.]